MHPEIAQGEPGRCSICGMNLLRTRTDADLHADKRGQDKHEGHSMQMFLRKFWVSLVLTIPVVAYRGPGREIINLILASAIFFYGGAIFLQTAWRELRGRRPGMMTLIALAISVAYGYSLYSVVLRPGMDLFWELSTLITVMLLGHYFEMRAVSGAQSALKELSKLLPDVAERITPPHLTSPTRGEELEERVRLVPISELKVGDLVLVRPGSKIPSDGEIVEGSSDLNEAMVSGESKPVSKKIGDKVIAGTINGDGSLKIKVTQIGEKTFLAGVMRLVSEAQASKSRLQILSDRAAYYLTIIALGSGAVTLAAWLLSRAGLAFALERVVAVLVIACPHALGLAIPLVAVISTGLAARQGFLVRQRLALESARNIDIVLFDKTGTLTRGEFGIDAVIPVNGVQEDEVLAIAASINRHSEHPVAKAIVKEAQSRIVKFSEVKNFQRIPGKGARGVINGKRVLLGTEVLLEEEKAGFPEEEADKLREATGKLAAQGKTLSYVISGEKLLGIIALGDIVREESRQAVAALKKLGLRTAMITGDSEDVAAWVASELGLDEYFARVLPDQKAQKVKLLQAKGQKVAMVGDGVNDAPALTQADVGIAIGAGTNVAIESAGIILVKNDPRDIVKIVELSRATYSKMIQNLWWAAGYNIIALPLAAGVLVKQGILLNPAVGALLMSLSTVIVAINAQFLRRLRLA